MTYYVIREPLFKGFPLGCAVLASLFRNIIGGEEMKRLLSAILLCCLCIGLGACEKKASAQIEYPAGWDRIAEATATLNQYYACETEEEYREVVHSSISDSDLKLMMDYWAEYRETWSMNDPAISEMYVRKIKYFDTHNGCDVFLVADGYVFADGERTPDDPLPPQKDSLAVAFVASGSLITLDYENGRYVIANTSGKEWQGYTEQFTFCTCDMGVVVVPGDPCKGCDGKGYLSEQKENDVCATCGGKGWAVSENEIRACPDCNIVSAIGGGKPCAACDGTGLENYSYGDCPDCGGAFCTRKN